ncbi:MAG TPA: NAD(+)/NADH kinase [Myxococcaceae bacterium]|nr:NAD(+)/NADH kinase [Myxococcaceae bacterium]
MKTVMLVAKRGKREAVALAGKIREHYPDLKLLAEHHLAEHLGLDTSQPEREMAAQADLVIVLGGDGTLIHASRLLAGRPVPLLGLNLGSLGFMTEIPGREAFAVLDEVLAGNFKAEPRMKLSCRLLRTEQVVIQDEVLNDVVINKGALARIGDHEMTVDGDYVTTFKADGVIVATPTGSTAYSMSAGGPIVHPAVDAIILTPICPHALTQRPIVIPGDQTISVTINGDAAEFYLTFDGQAGLALQPGDRIEVSRSPNRVLLIRNPRLGYFGMLRQKLRWGER